MIEAHFVISIAYDLRRLPKPRVKGTSAEENGLGNRLSGSSENIRPVVAL